MTKGNSMDDFLVQLGFDDKKAIKDMNRFMAKVRKMNPTVNPRVNTRQAQRVEQVKHKVERDNAYRVHKTRINYIKIEAARKKALDKQSAQDQKVKNFSNSSLIKTVAAGNPEMATEAIKKYNRLIRDGSQKAKEEVRGLTQSLRQQAQVVRKLQRESQKLNAVQRGLGDSANHMMRSYASVFALLGATTHINKVGQDFESLNSAMLAAMGTEAEAAKQIQYLDTMTDRLGLSLLDTADQYTKFTFAAKGKLPTEEVNLLFTGMSELGTTLGISKERMKLSFTAIQQMMNKSTISSEELKRQFAESMPGGIQLFADALNLSTRELLAQVESGKLLAEDVLPKVARQMQKVANNGGALTKKLMSTRVQQGRFFKEMESGSNLIFSSGFDVGAANMFNDLTEQMKLSSGGMKGLGKIFELVFKALGTLANVITPMLESLFYVLGNVADGILFIFEHKSGQIIAGIAGVGYAFHTLTGAVGGTNTMLKAFLATVMRILAPLLAVVAAVDDLMSNFDSQRTSTFEKKLGYQLFANDGSKKGTFQDRVLNGEGSKIIAPTFAGALDIADSFHRQFSSQQTQQKVEAVVVIDGVVAKTEDNLTNFMNQATQEGY